MLFNLDWFNLTLRFSGLDGKQPGDTAKLCSLIVDIIKGEGAAKGRTIPHTLQIGNDCYHGVKQSLEGTLATLEEWKDVIVATDADVQA